MYSLPKLSRHSNNNIIDVGAILNKRIRKFLVFRFRYTKYRFKEQHLKRGFHNILTLPDEVLEGGSRYFCLKLFIKLTVSQYSQTILLKVLKVETCLNH